MCKTALFIDGDNVSSKLIHKIFQFLINSNNDLNHVTIRKVFGECSNTGIGSNEWREACIEYSITPVHCINYRKGKNSTDIVLTIDVVETLYKHPEITNYIIITNDSDFTTLLVKLREHDKNILGFSENKAISKSLKNSFNEFHLLNETEYTPKQDNIKSVLELIFNQAHHYGYIDLKGFFNIDRIPAILKTINKELDHKKSGYKKLHEFLSKEFSEYLEFNVNQKKDSVQYLIKANTDKLNVNYSIINEKDREEVICQFFIDMIENAKELGYYKEGLMDIAFIPVIIKDKHMEFSIEDFGYKKISEFVIDFWYLITDHKLATEDFDNHKRYLLKKI